MACSPEFSNPVEIKRSLIDLMSTRRKAAADRLEREHGGVKGIAKRLHSSTKKGLLGIQDGLSSRDVFGLNYTPLTNPQSFPKSLLLSFTDAVLLILILGAIAALVLGYYHPEICDGIEQTRTAWMEGCGILATVLVIIFVSAVSDFWRDYEFYIMQQRLDNSRRCLVIRSGKEKEICYQHIKVGDLCVVKVGSIIPADGVLTQTNEIITNESILGAEERVVKGIDDPLVFAGSYVTEGSARFLVTAVGDNTQVNVNTYSKFADPPQELDPAYDRKTLQGKLNKTSAVLALIGIIIGVLVTAIIIIRFSVQTYSIDNNSYDSSHWIEFVQAIILGIVVIIIVEPEGLSLAVTITLSYCVNKMYASKVLVRNVDALESMGNLTTLCCGKTGVLTQLSKMSVTEKVVESFLAEQQFRGNPRYYKNKLPPPLVDDLCVAISVNTSYSSNITPSGPQCLPQQIGDRTECALLQFVLDMEQYYPFIRKEYPRETFVKVFDFSPERRSMTTIVRDGDGVIKIYSKGAPEVVLKHCTAVMKRDGSTKTFLPEDRVKVQNTVKQMKENSQLKVMCIAYRHVHPGISPVPQLDKEEEVMSQLILIGLMGIDTLNEQSDVRSRKQVSEGSLGGERFMALQDLKAYRRTLTTNFLEEICRGIAVNTNYSTNIKEESSDNLPVQVGDSTEGALLQFLLKLGETYQFWRDEFPQDTHVRKYSSVKGTDPSQQFAATVLALNDGGGYKLYCHGGVEYVLPRCSRLALPSLDTRKIEEDVKYKIRKQAYELEKRKQLEVVCLAFKHFPSSFGANENELEENDILSGLTFLGVIGIDEAVRQEVPDVVGRMQDAGIRMCMVTGDSLGSAGSFGAKAGILSLTKDWPLAEWSFYGCDSNALKRHLEGGTTEQVQQNFDEWWPNELRILANAGHKERLDLVKMIMGSHSRPDGEVVAVTASGVNDDKVLSNADVGLTMGTGTDVAKESADIVLQDDDFSSILDVVKWGRNVYESVLKFLQFQFTVTWVAIIVVVIGACVTKRSPLSATQLLWINLIMDSLASLALTRDPPSEDLLRHKPYGRNKPLISRSLLRNVIGHAIYQLAVMFVLIFKAPDWLDMRDGYDQSTVCRPTQHSTMVFTTFVFMQLFHEINCRRVQDRNVFYGVLYGRLKDINILFIVIWIATFGIQIIIVQFFTNAFRVLDMEWYQWMWCLFLGFSELIWGQVIFSIPKVFIPRSIRCCSSGISSQGKAGCCERLALIRGISKVRRQNQVMYRFYGKQNKRYFDNIVSPGEP